MNKVWFAPSRCGVTGPMRNVYLFQPQYAIEFRREINYWLPYSAGCVWSYAQQFGDIRDNYCLKDIVFYRDPADAVMINMQDPDVCGFSCYAWNREYCLDLARRIKQQWPQCAIIFGGAESSSSMLQYDFINTIVMGEGEHAFLDLLRLRLQGRPLPELHRAPRIADLDFPSPYLLGLFDPLIQRHPDAVWAMSLETNRGCPYACTFCDWGGTTYSKVKKFGLERIAAELAWAADHPVAYIFCTDANFGMFRERDLAIAQLMSEAAQGSYIESINLQYAKNSTKAVFDIAKVIGPLGRGVTVSVQSMNDDTLAVIKRQNLDVNNIAQLMALSAEHGVPTYSELILGLPLETADTWRAGITDLLELGQHQSIDMWFTQMLENSELATIKSRTYHGIKTTRVDNYFNFNMVKTHDDIVERAELVRETNTMSTTDMIECYMYGWMIIHMHVTGYSQLVARYARSVHGIPYRCFYDAIFTDLHNDLVIAEHYRDLENIVREYLTRGVMLDPTIGGHALHTKSYLFMYQNRERIARLALKQLPRPVPDDLEILQKHYILDISTRDPKEICTAYNVFTGSTETTRYRFEPQALDGIDDYYALRRKGLLKNKVTLS